MNVNTWHQDNTPKYWEDVLEKLKSFETLNLKIKKEKKQSSIPTHTLKSFYELHDDLVTQTYKADRSSSDLQSIETQTKTLDDSFIEAFWLSLDQYPKLVNHSDIENIDTAGSKIFTLFKPDAPTEIAERNALKSKFQEIFQLSTDTLEKITKKLVLRTAPLQHRHQIMTSLQTQFKLVSDNPELESDVLRLFQKLYPAAPFEVGEVKLIKTCSALYFCLPSKVKEITTDPSTEIKAVETDKTQNVHSGKKLGYAQFLRRIWQVEPFAHFPVFGTFNAQTLDPSFRQAIADDTGLSTEIVTTTLTRMIGFLPLEELDKYLIHDTWGHQWQESLLDFEELYTKLSLFNLPLSVTESASVLGEKTTFGDAFLKTASGKIHLDVEILTKFIDAELYERSIVAFTPILAEMLADVVEYKFLKLYPEQSHLMPSSSLLKDYPSKLDLTLEDLHNCFERAAEAFQTWVDSEEVKTRIHAEICEKLDITDCQINQKELDSILEMSVQICKERLEMYYKPEWYWEKTSDDCLKVNAFSFAALNFLRIHAAFLHTFEKLSQIETNYGFMDLLVLAMGTFFENEPQRNIWQLDRFLTDGFLPRWNKLAQAI